MAAFACDRFRKKIKSYYNVIELIKKKFCLIRINWLSVYCQIFLFVIKILVDWKKNSRMLKGDDDCIIFQILWRNWNEDLIHVSITHITHNALRNTCVRLLRLYFFQENWETVNGRYKWETKYNIFGGTLCFKKKAKIARSSRTTCVAFCAVNVNDEHTKPRFKRKYRG